MIENVFALIAGWFSFEEGHATAGDLLTRDLVCEWLRGLGCRYDVALAPPFVGGVNWRKAEPSDYTHVIFVCGPFQQAALEKMFIDRFSEQCLIGINLSMLSNVGKWQPFDFLLERDSSAAAFPDLAFLTHQNKVPIVGVCLVENYPGSFAEAANAAINRFVQSREVSIVHIDTRLDINGTGLRTAAEIESLLARMDAVITTRLHGIVLSLKNGVPVIAIDPMGDGAKLLRQAETIGWPAVIRADQTTDEQMQKWLDYCLSQDGRTKASACAERARTLLVHRHAEFITALKTPLSDVPHRRIRADRSSLERTRDRT